VLRPGARGRGYPRPPARGLPATRGRAGPAHRCPGGGGRRGAPAGGGRRPPRPGAVTAHVACVRRRSVSVVRLSPTVTQCLRRLPRSSTRLALTTTIYVVAPGRVLRRPRPPRRRPTADDLSDLEVEVEVTQVWYAVQVTALTDHGSYGPRFLFVVVTEQRGGAAPAGPGALYGVRGDDRPPRTSAPIAGA
jgi:hypothetical protein